MASGKRPKKVIERQYISRNFIVDVTITDVTIELLEAEKANLLGQLEKESKR